MTHIKTIKADITKIEVDAIVNAANKTLYGGGGVDGAIHFGAGRELLAECVQIRETKYADGLPTGEAVLTKGYNLPAKYIIHTVGPIWESENGKEKELLYNCYYNSLKLANKKKIKSIAFPSISTGAFRFPKDLADQIARQAINDFLEKEKSNIEEIFLVKYHRKKITLSDIMQEES